MSLTERQWVFQRDKTSSGDTRLPEKKCALTDRMSCMPVHARLTILMQHNLFEKREHKTDHNSGSCPPLEIKNSALDRIYHAGSNGNSFKARKLQNKLGFKLF